MRCTYERTIYQNNDNSFCIVAYKTDDTSVPATARSKSYTDDKLIRFTATGYRLPTTNAFDVEIDGQWKDSKYGMQLAVESCVEIVPKTTAGITGYLASGLIAGIGEKTAEAIVARFGMKSLEILDNQPEKLLEIKGITEKKLKKITESYSQSKAIRDIVTYLSPFGISAKKAVKIQKAFGGQSMEILRNRPFELCSISGFAFKTVDAIATKIGCMPNDPMRIRGALAFVLDESMFSGHLYLPSEVLCQKAFELLNEGAAKAVAEREVQTELYRMTKENRFIAEGANIYSLSNFKAESVVAEKIASMLIEPVCETDISKELKEAQHKLGITLSAKQEDAVKMAFKHRLSIITGGPGTGKTTVLKTVLTVYEEVVKGEVLLTAPTGRASRRMSESTGRSGAMTLHSALGLVSDEENSFLNSSGELQEDFIIIDEYSMVDMRLAYELFTRIKKGAKILLVGDAEQLPSVGAGNVFYEFINCGLLPTTFLDVVFRQSNLSRIALNAQTIREDKTGLLYGPDFVFISCENGADAAQIILKEYQQAVSISDISKVQILSPFKSRGDAGSKNLNDLVRALINPPAASKPELNADGRIFRLGDRVLQTKNKGEVSNGDIGFIKSVYSSKENDSYVTIEFSEDRIVEYGKDELDIIEHSFAMTIHKSQGSEYETVIIPMLKEFYIMLRRNLLYTAITRAKKKVILVGQKQALFCAIHKNDTNERNTLLGERILRCHGELLLEEVRKKTPISSRRAVPNC